MDAEIVQMPVAPRRESVKQAQERMIAKRISDAAAELEILARELKDHPLDITVEAASGIYDLWSRIDAAGHLLNARDHSDVDADSRKEAADLREFVPGRSV